MTTTARHSQRSSWDSPQPYPQKRLHRNPSAAGSETINNSQSPSTAAAVSSLIMSPPFFATPRSPPQPQTSPGYFNLKVEPGTNAADSDAACYTKQNWSPATSNKSPQSTAAPSPQILPPGGNIDFEAFRRQSESGIFTLSHGNLAHFAKRPSIQATNGLEGAGSPRPHVASPLRDSQQQSFDAEQTNPFDSQPPSTSSNATPRQEAPSFFGQGVQASPGNIPSAEFANASNNRITRLDDRHPRLSMPQIAPGPPSPLGVASQPARRTETVPPSTAEAATMVTAQDLAQILRVSRDEVLMLDVRVYPQFAQSRISGALNLCIPTTLLKRPSFNVQKLAETFTNEKERAVFEQWRKRKYIVVYDAASVQMKDAISPTNTLKKFASQGWRGKSLILRGGFSEFARQCPDLVNNTATSNSPAARKSLSIASSMPGAAPVAGGCAMPSSKSAANPFFGNIRQNMDLIGGVGQLPVTQPPTMTKQNEAHLPAWMREASAIKDKGKAISEKFLHIEKTEQKRMQEALSGGVHYGSPTVDAPKSVQIAGIEKGTKNRYNNIWPFDHSRVKLQGVPQGSCDYINASHIKAPWSKKHYIATQAPIPATFDDFWRVVWEQNVRVIVMLTAEMEGGQMKCHPYWKGRDFGPLRLEALSERRVSLDMARNVYAGERNGISSGRRRSTQIDTKDVSTPSGEPRFIIVRKFSLTHTAFPFTPIREITQLQYSSWPDFGAPAHPSDLLGLVDQCNAVLRATFSPSLLPNRKSEPDPTSKSPILVHCSAGCGRTGTFCTVDSVIDTLKRQRLSWGSGAGSGSTPNDSSSGSSSSNTSSHEVGHEQNDRSQLTISMEIDTEGQPPRSSPLAEQKESSEKEKTKNDSNWKKRDDLDLVAQTVEAFRDQRLSMVQSLRQFVLCYESVLEWLVVQQHQQEQQQAQPPPSASSLSSSISSLSSASAEHGSSAHGAALRPEGSSHHHHHHHTNQFREEGNKDGDYGAGNSYFGF